MLKRLLLGVLCCALLLVAGCSEQVDVSNIISTNTTDTGIIEIKEKYFIESCNDVYLNPDLYIGKLIKIEGMYEEFINESSGEKYMGVIRYGPGCCGNDGVAGFEFTWAGETPEVNDWIEVVGSVAIINDENQSYVVLDANSLTVLDVRGLETVAN